MNILDEIVENKKIELQSRLERLPLKIILDKLGGLPQPRDFKKAVSKPGAVNLIAEIKKASPSEGDIVEKFDVRYYAKQYEKAGAAAVSVLTEKRYFKGDIFHLDIARQVMSLPILRKDFFIDEYQIYESRYFGADAVLLIVSILGSGKLSKFLKVSGKLGLAALVEVHNEYELDDALSSGASIIGINNRNLADFSVDLDTTLRLKSKIPSDKIVVSESGINTKQQVEILKKSKINAILIGKYLMKSENIPDAVKGLFPDH